MHVRKTCTITALNAANETPYDIANVDERKSGEYSRYFSISK
jgi:hypothetical protein